MTKIIDFNKQLYPVGSVAYHPTYRSCTIIKQDGLNRRIRYGRVVNGTLVFKYTQVPVKELKDYLRMHR